MEIILLERVERLGQMGDVVTVKPGYARNFLLPHNKALRATKSNLAFFETQKAQLEAENLKRRDEAQAVADKINGHKVVLVRSAGEMGQLYGSVTSRDIAIALADEGVSIDRRQVQIAEPIKTLGLFDLKISLHPEVSVTVVANVARSEEEAQIQDERGGMITATELRDEADAEAEAELQAARDAVKAEMEAEEEAEALA